MDLCQHIYKMAWYLHITFTHLPKYLKNVYITSNTNIMQTLCKQLPVQGKFKLILEFLEIFKKYFLKKENNNKNKNQLDNKKIFSISSCLNPHLQNLQTHRGPTVLDMGDSVYVLTTWKHSMDCKEIQPVHPKGNQSWIFIGRTDAEAETPIFGHLMRRTDSLEKTLMLGKIEGRRRRGW